MAWGLGVRLLGFLGLLVTGTQCAPHPRPASLPTKPNTHSQIKTWLTAPSWNARFSNATELSTCVELNAQSRLCVGALGERWLDGPDGALASPYLAPETLVSALPADSSTWEFVGRHGNRYTANSPLGPFTAMRRPPQKYTRYAAVAGHWIGLTEAGELWRGTEGDLVGTRLTVPQRIFDFAVTQDGNGVALGIPERIWMTQNQGADWQAQKIGPFGVKSVLVDAQGGLTLAALIPSPELKVEGIPLHTTNAASNAGIHLRHRPAVFAEAQGFVEGRTARLDADFVELRKIEDSWQVARGTLDKPLDFAKTHGLEGCTALRFAMSSESSLVVCRRGVDETVTLLASDKRALDFRQLPGVVAGRFSDVRVAAVAAHRFIATGLCAPSSPQPNPLAQTLINKKSYTSCHPKAPVTVELSQPSPKSAQALALGPVTAAGAQLTAPAIAVSPDGTRVAFVARSSMTQPWQLYYSTDGGKTFGAQSIDELPATGAPKSRQPKPAMTKGETREIQSLSFAEDASLSLVLKDGDTPVVFNFDDRGSLMAAAMPPPGVSRLDAVGSRILAVSLTERDVYESLDRGASFELVGHLPAAACLTWLPCAVICTTRGCLIGERFTRISWGGRGAYPLDIAGNPEAAAFEPKTERVLFRTPVVCQSSNKGSTAGLTHAPLSEQTSLAETLWMSPWQDWKKGSAGVFRVQRGRNQVEESMAFGPVSHAERAGLAVNFDDAGLAFLRSAAVPKVGEAFGELELGWMTYKLPNWLHARFRDAVPTKNGDSYLLGIDKARKLLPSQLSVSGNGVFVQPHADEEYALGATFVTPGKSRALQKIAWPVERIRDQQLLTVGDAWLAFAFDETGSILLRARSGAATDAQDGAWEFTAQTVANPFASRSAIEDQVNPYYGGGRPYLILGAAARGRQLQSIELHELTSTEAPLGPPVRLPLPASLNEPPPACTARDRRELTRLVVPLLPAAARAIGFRDGKDQVHWLVADRAVMYASEVRACLDVLWAETLPGMTPIHAVIPLEDSRHAWVFLSKRAKGESKLDAQPVECRFDSAANPPPEFETRTQARFNLEQLHLGD